MNKAQYLKELEQELVDVMEYRQKRRKAGKVFYGKFNKYWRLRRECKRAMRAMSFLNQAK